MKWIKIFIIVLIIYALPKQSAYTFGISVKSPDQRVSKLQNFLLAKKSPLAYSAPSFIKAADKYKLDWKLLPSIAGVESGFEKAGNLYDNNPFGYMCGSSPCDFDSYDQAIFQVAKTISRSPAYKEYRSSRSISDLAIVYNRVSPEDWSRKIGFFYGKLK